MVTDRKMVALHLVGRVKTLALCRIVAEESWTCSERISRKLIWPVLLLKESASHLKKNAGRKTDENARRNAKSAAKRERRSDVSDERSALSTKSSS